MGLLMPGAQQTEGQWTGQAQTKVPLQIPRISSALSPLVTVVSFSAKAMQLSIPTCEPLEVLDTSSDTEVPEY